MVSKSFLLFALVFATVLLVTSEIAAAKKLTSNHESEVEDAKYGGGYDNGGGRGGYDNGGGRGGYDNGGGRGGYDNGGGRGGNYHNRGGNYNNGGGHGRGYCRYGCCGGGRYYNNGGCRCCSTLAEATAYKQAQEAQTHN